MNVGVERRSFEVPGEIVRVKQDQQKNEWFYIMTKERGGAGINTASNSFKNTGSINQINENSSVGGGGGGLLETSGSDVVRLFVIYYNKIYEIREGLEYALDSK